MNLVTISRQMAFGFAPIPLLLTIPLLLLILAATNYAQGLHTLQGKVVLPNGIQPQTPIKVTLTFNGRRIYETFTDLSGRFTFGALNRGTYQLTAEGDGSTFETTTIYAEVSAFGSAPQTFTQNIQLRPRASKQLPPTGVISVEAFDSNIPEAARKEFEKGVKRASDNQPERAIKNFQEAIRVYPDYYDAHVLMGEQYAKLQRNDEAKTAYQKAIQIKADRADAYIGFGVLLVKQKSYQDALIPLRRGIELNKQSSTAHLFLGFAQMMTSDYAAAEVNLLRAYEIDKPALAHIYLANLYDLKGEPVKAIQQLEAFLKENPESPNSRQIREVIEKLRKQAQGKK